MQAMRQKNRRKHYMQQLAEALDRDAEARMQELARKLVFNGLENIHRKKWDHHRVGRDGIGRRI